LGPLRPACDSVGAGPAEHGRQRLEQDLEIQPHHLLEVGDGAAATDLPQPGDPGPRAEPAEVEAEGLIVEACRDGFSPPEKYLELAAGAKPELIILAMGMPKINGGAILDYLGEKVTRAPEFMRSHGMEWVYRLYLEPKRLARRYLLGIPAFFSHVVVTTEHTESPRGSRPRGA
jgi:hypothetical protein